jgi:AraC-like DNA-binding protein
MLRDLLGDSGASLHGFLLIIAARNCGTRGLGVARARLTARVAVADINAPMATEATHDDSGLHLFRELLRLGLPAAKLFDEARLGDAHRRGELRPPRAAMLSIKAAASRLLGDHCLGFDFSNSIDVDQQGLFVAALMHAKNLRDMLEVARAHIHLWEHGTEVRAEERGAITRVHYRIVADDPVAASIESQLSMMVQARILLRRMPAMKSVVTVGFACDPPAHPQCEAPVRRLGVHARFREPGWYFDLPTSVLDEPLPATHPVVSKLIEERLERVHEHVRSETPFLERLRQVLREGLSRRWSASDVASACSMSTRTLQQRLTEHGTSLTEQLAAVRLELAQTLLEHDSISIEQVADRAGFDSLPAFSRFFRRQTGVAPSAFRASRSSK